MITLFVILCLAGMLISSLSAPQSSERLSSRQEEEYDLLVLRGNKYIIAHDRILSQEQLKENNIRQLKEIIKYQQAWKSLGLELTLEESAELWIIYHAAQWRKQHLARA